MSNQLLNLDGTKKKVDILISIYRLYIYVTIDSSYKISDNDIRMEVVMMAGNIVYRVTGRYMAGSEVTEYHLVGSDGSTLRVGKDKAILMISRGLIENMRVQYSGSEVIIRGKGTNLNNLPVYDIKKDNFRSNNTPVQGTTARTTRQNPMAQYKIIKRIMFKTSCVGYTIQDATGKEVNINSTKAKDMALRGFFTNADARKYMPNGETEPRVVIRGVGCDLKNLPVILVDQSGNTVDTTKKSQNVGVRAYLSHKAGILYNSEKQVKSMFNAGDYLICTPTGEVAIMKSSIAASSMKNSMDTTAICDNYLDRLSSFSVEFLGDQRRAITPTIVKRWRIVTIVKEKEVA